jgi:hypothetical protein
MYLDKYCLSAVGWEINGKVKWKKTNIFEIAFSYNADTDSDIDTIIMHIFSKDKPLYLNHAVKFKIYLSLFAETSVNQESITIIHIDKNMYRVITTYDGKTKVDLTYMLDAAKTILVLNRFLDQVSCSHRIPDSPDTSYCF